jgi:hypothetical protein
MVVPDETLLQANAATKPIRLALMKTQRRPDISETLPNRMELRVWPKIRAGYAHATLVLPPRFHIIQKLTSHSDRWAYRWPRRQ